VTKPPAPRLSRWNKFYKVALQVLNLAVECGKLLRTLMDLLT
jgi:hypothetical protein